MNYAEIVEAEGHLVDSQILARVMDRVIECGAVYEVIEFRLGRTNDEFSQLKLRVSAPNKETLDKTLLELVELGCYQAKTEDAILKPAPFDKVVPDDFYSTTNHRTFVRSGGAWIEVSQQRMDAVIILKDGANGKTAECRKLREVKAGEQILCGKHGIRIQPEFKERDRLGFAFMANEISSERRAETAVRKIAEIMRQIKAEGGRIIFVAGPVVIHTGGSQAFCEIIRKGYVDALLAGNAIAVHDIEHTLFGTSLGVDLEHGNPIEEGHKNHMRAINTINRYGSIKGAVEAGALRSGVMYELVKHEVPFVLAGSIRDDGPLPDTEMDLLKAQEAYAAQITEAKLVICLSTMLHSIGVGNMTPSWVRMVCVDINPAVVTKLSDRGSAQTVGVVTDVGTFLNLLAQRLWT
ncbi:MAG: TIGR00300 family protein [Acidobacteria bacterium]|nr:TIGR00300 family protein [Acidobacteriota bacterium]MBI3426440.1 TIGR00300 family protein [Acidobacteriota bacterium]